MKILKLGNRIGVIILAAALLVGGLYAQDRISVAGLVVDNNNRPIKEATVGFEFPSPAVRPSQGYDVATPGTLSLADGAFFLESTVRTDFVWLIIETPTPENLVRAIDRTDLKRFNEFRGLRLKVPKDRTFVYQLEYINPHITYRKVEFDLKRLFANFSNCDSCEITYSINHKNKRLVSNVAVDKRSFNNIDKKLSLAFPVGRWTVILKLHNGLQDRTEKLSISVN